MRSGEYRERLKESRVNVKVIQIEWSQQKKNAVSMDAVETDQEESVARDHSFVLSVGQDMLVGQKRQITIFGKIRKQKESERCYPN
jgi:hypothetical protein